MTTSGSVRFTELIACALFALFALACAERPAPRPAHTVGPAGDGPTAGEPTAAEVRCPARAIAGLPFPVRLVFRGEAEVPVSTGLFAADNPFSITLRPVAAVRQAHDGDVLSVSKGVTGEDGTAYVFPVRLSRRTLLGPVRRRGRGEPRKPAGPVGTMTARTGRRGPTFALPEGRTCEVVLDMSGLACVREAEGGETQLRQFRRLSAGPYALEIGHPSLAFETPAAQVEFAAPSAEGHRLLARLNNLGPVESVWKTFVLGFPELTEGVDLAELRPEAREQIGFHLLLARLVHSGTPLEDLAIADDEIAALLPAYRTEARLLRFEIELACLRADTHRQARGDEEAAGKTREAILAVRPYAAEALDGIAEGGGIIAELRRAAETAGAAQEKP